MGNGALPFMFPYNIPILLIHIGTAFFGSGYALGSNRMIFLSQILPKQLRLGYQL